MSAANPEMPMADQSDYPGWRSVFFTGLLLWLASVIVTAVTGNVNMIPTVVLLGSFLVPVTAVVWYLDHDPSPTLTPRVVLNAFITGGVLGVLAASLLEAWLLGDGMLIYVGVGLIEEGAKLIALLIIARRLLRYTTRDGVVLGAAVGFGFAALESSGYAFSALLVQNGQTVALSLGNLVGTEFLRGILAPVGHGLWTGILGGVLFQQSAARGRLRVTRRVFWAFLFVALLHALWDSMRGIATVLTELLTTTPMQQIAVGMGQLVPPTARQVHTFEIIDWAGLVLISVIGLLVLRRIWRRAPSVNNVAIPSVAPG